MKHDDLRTAGGEQIEFRVLNGEGESVVVVDVVLLEESKAALQIELGVDDLQIDERREVEEAVHWELVDEFVSGVNAKIRQPSVHVLNGDGRKRGRVQDEIGYDLDEAPGVAKVARGGHNLGVPIVNAKPLVSLVCQFDALKKDFGVIT